MKSRSIQYLFSRFIFTSSLRYFGGTFLVIIDLTDSLSSNRFGWKTWSGVTSQNDGTLMIVSYFMPLLPVISFTISLFVHCGMVTSHSFHVWVARFVVSNCRGSTDSFHSLCRQVNYCAICTFSHFEAVKWHFCELPYLRKAWDDSVYEAETYAARKLEFRPIPTKANQLTFAPFAFLTLLSRPNGACRQLIGLR